LFVCLFNCTKSHIFAYSNRQIGTISYIIKIMIKVILYEIKINLMLSLLFFFFLILPFRLILPLLSLDNLLPIFLVFYACIFKTVSFIENKSKLLSFIQYSYIFTFALVLGYIAYLPKQYELVSFSFCLYAFISWNWAQRVLCIFTW
jgi:hypothetical protein